jgi:hypothetical protein
MPAAVHNAAMRNSLLEFIFHLRSLFLWRVRPAQLIHEPRCRLRELHLDPIPSIDNLFVSSCRDCRASAVVVANRNDAEGALLNYFRE